MDDLTPRQREVLETILVCVEENGRFPSIREIAAQLNLGSPATVHQHLAALETKSYLYRRDRHWQLRPEVRRDRGVPIVGRVAAGMPLTAVEAIEGTLNPEFMGLIPGRFGVKVVGESMSGEGILDGDYVVIDPDLPAGQGDLIVAYVGDEQEVTVKRFYRDKAGIELRPANPSFEPLFIAADDTTFRVGGKVVGLIRRF